MARGSCERKDRCFIYIPIHTGVNIMAFLQILEGIYFFIFTAISIYENKEVRHFPFYLNLAGELIPQSPYIFAQLLLLRWLLEDTQETRKSLITVGYLWTVFEIIFSCLQLFDQKLYFKFGIVLLLQSLIPANTIYTILLHSLQILFSVYSITIFTKFNEQI